MLPSVAAKTETSGLIPVALFSGAGLLISLGVMLLDMFSSVNGSDVTAPWQGRANARGTSASPNYSTSQVPQEGFAGFLGFRKSVERRTAHFDGRLVHIDGTPRGDKAGRSVEARTTAALLADHEREAAFFFFRSPRRWMTGARHKTAECL